jgi:hypothetical protein
MKKTFYVLAVVATLITTGCTFTPPPDAVPMGMKVTWDDLPPYKQDLICRMFVANPQKTWENFSSGSTTVKEQVTQSAFNLFLDDECS